MHQFRVGNLLLIPTIAHMGPPLATALASTVNVALLYGALRKRGHLVLDAQLKRRIPRAGVAALLMGAAMWFGNVLFQPYVTGTWPERWGAMLLLVTAGVLVYAAAVLVTGAFRPSEVRALLRRSSKA